MPSIRHGGGGVSSPPPLLRRGIRTYINYQIGINTAICVRGQQIMIAIDYAVLDIETNITY